VFFGLKTILLSGRGAVYKGNIAGEILNCIFIFHHFLKVAYDNSPVRKRCE